MTSAAELAPRTIWIADDQVWTYDQTRLPHVMQTLCLDSSAACERAIRTMQVRGAPLIGAVAAYGLALALRESASDESLQSTFASLLAARPTAVNLRWALERIRKLVAPLSVGLRAAAAWAEAGVICDEDVICNRAIGEALIAQLPPSQGKRPLQILTHCNAGRLATVAYGTALAPIYLLHERGIPVHVWVDETRPRNQGASITAWELADRGIPHTLIADNAGGLLMMRGEVDVVIVGADRVTRNGDVINKIGTYLKALAAAAHNIPFLVACPISTIDMRTANGSTVEIEFRNPTELTHMTGVDDQDIERRVLIAPPTTAAANPAFDVTPAALVSSLVTERGSRPATEAGIASLELNQ